MKITLDTILKEYTKKYKLSNTEKKLINKIKVEKMNKEKEIEKDYKKIVELKNKIKVLKDKISKRLKDEPTTAEKQKK